MPETTVHIPSEWREVAEEILVHQGPVMVMGAAGVGKSTFCLFLTGYFCNRGGRVVWIDADPGQPFFGPPAVISVTSHIEPVDVIKRKSPLFMGFVGDTSPVGHLLEIASGLHKLFDHAKGLDPDLIIVNTCGLVNGGAARELAFHEIDMLAPRYLVAIQKGAEAEHLLTPHSYHDGLLIRRLPVSSNAHPPTREARLAARELRFKEYFRGADFQEIALSDVGVHGPGLATGERLGFRDVNRLSNILQAIVVHAELAADRLFLVTDGEYTEDGLYAAKELYQVREATVFKRSDLDHLLLGLNDERNLCLGLGILRELDFREQSIKVITPIKDTAPVRHLSFGSLRVSPAGMELGRW